MTYRLVIPGSLPGLNEYIEAERRSKYAAAGMKRRAEAVIAAAAREQLRGVRLTGPVVMGYTWVEKNRRRDRDNVAFARKFVQDALVRCGVLRGDGWKEIAGFTDAFAVDRERPRVEVTLREVEEENAEV